MSLTDRLLDIRPLRSSRAFRDLWIGSSVGTFGYQFATVAVLLQVWEMTHSPVWTGAIGLVNAIPQLVFGMVGGSLADAMDRRTLVRLTTLGQVLVATGLTVQALLRLDSLAVLFLLIGLASAFNALGSPARRTFPVRLLPADQVGAGLALQNLAFQASMLVGPALAGLVLAKWGLAPTYLVQAVAGCASLIAVIRLPAMPPQGTVARAGLRQSIDGLRFIRTKPALWGSFATDLAATLLAMPIALFPLINELRFGGNPQTLGLFLSAIAVGGIGAGLLSGMVTRARRAGLIQLIAAGTWGIALAVVGFAQPLWLVFAALAVAGAADTVSVVTRGAMVQLATPDSHRGRVSAVDHIVGVGGPEVGNFRAGLVAGLTSAPVALISGGLACAAIVGALALTNRPLRTFTIEPATLPDQAPAR
ncbi:MFS transporter [Occultella gossypii]|uniref:MFS transporter n=1 Tax=Occultella gossypii TaxID=2800820 RepID=A0ABS7SEY4_9MICO|nr:MFS transporter [Occultella gossypii]MBZ2198921.1 MFS transporter [Occultella gossypii]